MTAARPIHTVAVLAAAVLWGTTGTVAHFAPAGSSPLLIGLATFGVGGLVLALLSWRAVARVLADRSAWPWLLAGGAGAVLYPTAYYPAMDLAGVAVGNVLALGFGPIVAAALEWVLDGRRPTARWAVATVIAAAGVALLAVGSGESTAGSDPLLGIALALAAGVGYALYAYAGARLIAGGRTSQGSMASIFLVGAVVMVPAFLVLGPGPLASAHGIATLAFLALVPMALAYLLFGMALRALAASTATTLALAEPVVATLLAVLVVHERLGALAWIGLAAVAVGIVLVSLPSRRGRLAAPARPPA
ncbi:EamA family transporter [Agrococcus versicolor]|uniref:EamA family transporter n=1 Tax=Agrococcus versicolor TaxID=501482 RepID=A0ABP5MK39_9MICO